MKALVVNAPGGGFALEDIDIAVPIGREVLVDVHGRYRIEAFVEPRAVLEV